MTVTDDHLDALLERADPVPPAFDRDPAVRAAVVAIGRSAGRRSVVRLATRRSRTPPPLQPRRRRLLLAGALGSVVVAATTGAAAAGFIDLHTGLFGSPGMTENDATEFLDTASPHLPSLLADYADATPLAPGSSLEPLVENLQRNPGLAQERGLRGSVALYSDCTWQRAWLDADERGDAAAEEQALAVLREVPTWPALVAVDGGGLAAGAASRAEAAAAGDRAPIERNVELNCGTTP